MNSKNSEAGPKGIVILTGLDIDKRPVVERQISVVDYYESLHPILDEDYGFRTKHGIRYVKGKIYDYEGKLDQEFINDYDDKGVYISSRIVFADGTIVKDEHL